MQKFAEATNFKRLWFTFVDRRALQLWNYLDEGKIADLLERVSAPTIDLRSIHFAAEKITIQVSLSTPHCLYVKQKQVIMLNLRIHLLDAQIVHHKKLFSTRVMLRHIKKYVWKVHQGSKYGSVAKLLNQREILKYCNVLNLHPQVMFTKDCKVFKVRDEDQPPIRSSRELVDYPALHSINKCKCDKLIEGKRILVAHCNNNRNNE